MNFLMTRIWYRKDESGFSHSGNLLACIGIVFGHTRKEKENVMVSVIQDTLAKDSDLLFCLWKWQTTWSTQNFQYYTGNVTCLQLQYKYKNVNFFSCKFTMYGTDSVSVTHYCLVVIRWNTVRTSYVFV